MTVSEHKKMLEGYLGDVKTPSDFEEFWRNKVKSLKADVSIEAVEIENPAAVYEQIYLTVEDRRISARCIRPAKEGKHPLILMFHDLHRGVRGWHHMTRFIALGYAVIALEAEAETKSWTDLGQMDFVKRFCDALALANAAAELPFADQGRITTWGEGFGGGLAVVTAALLSCQADCAVINPMPAELGAFSYVDVANFAPMVRGKVLMGVCLLDSVAPPEGQAAIYNRLKCQKHLCVYPKYGHERVNFFENELVKFLHD